MIEDVKRLEREMKAQTYEISKQEISALKAINRALDELLSNFRHKPLKLEFGNDEARERHFQISKDFPERYYYFQCFKTTITIWPRPFQGKEYCVATYGYVLKSEHFIYEKGYNGEYMYWNPTNDYAKAVSDWYLAVTEYMATEIGITVKKDEKTMQLEFELGLPTENKTIKAEFK